ncbi:nose resistant to fluoxetine protein 6-like isoform X2 [Megachile rotundata]|uniref:nose resistant to fluoxetine protein 6-like isoform X2 n=1 Tax=Megachile rotundata TaxID=143995 RepID=UPI003FD4C347
MRYKWIGIIVLMYLCTLIHGVALDLALMENMPGYAVISTIEQLNRTRCRTELEQFRDAVDRRILWSLKMLDTSGQPSSGYILGNNFWMGNRVQCESLSQKLPFVYSPQNAKNNSRFRNPADEYPPYELNFFGAYIHERGTIQYRHTSMSREDVIILGLCLPASCTEDEVTTMVTKVLDDRLLLADRLYSMDLKLLRVSDLRPDYASFFNAKIIIIILILTALLGTVIAGTLYDMLVVQTKLKEHKECSSDQSKELQDTGEMELNNIVEKKASHEEIAVIQKPKTVSRSVGILTYFSIYSNLKEIFDVSNLSEDLKMMHGIRVFGTVWIIVGHAIIYSSNTSDRGQVFINLGTLPYQVMTNATLQVETYLFLSGFVLTFGYIKSQRKPRSFRECVIGFVGGVIKRYVRLTPAHMVTILIVIVTFTYLSHTSLVFPIEPAHESCSKYWWQNVLYINSFYEWKDICMSWTWYISNDMQLYMLGTFLLMLSTCYYYATLSLSVTMIIVASVYRAYVTYATEYYATVDTKFETLSSMYIRPWMRVQTYLLGMGAALILHKLNYKLHLSKKVVAVCWCLSILCNCSIIFGVPNVNKSLVSSIVYESFFKIGWSLGIGWLIVACVTNNGGIINRFLSLSCWVPFSRVSLFAYLIDPVVVLFMNMCSNYGYPSEFYNVLSVGLGQLVLIYILAFVMSAVCEVPAVLLLRAQNSSRIKR